MPFYQQIADFIEHLKSNNTDKATALAQKIIQEYGLAQFESIEKRLETPYATFKVGMLNLAIYYSESIAESLINLGCSTTKKIECGDPYYDQMTTLMFSCLMERTNLITKLITARSLLDTNKHGRHVLMFPLSSNIAHILIQKAMSLNVTRALFSIRDRENKKTKDYLEEYGTRGTIGQAMLDADIDTLNELLTKSAVTEKELMTEIQYLVKHYNRSILRTKLINIEIDIAITANQKIFNYPKSNLLSFAITKRFEKLALYLLDHGLPVQASTLEMAVLQGLPKILKHLLTIKDPYFFPIAYNDLLLAAREVYLSMPTRHEDYANTFHIIYTQTSYKPKLLTQAFQILNILEVRFTKQLYYHPNNYRPYFETLLQNDEKRALQHLAHMISFNTIKILNHALIEIETTVGKMTVDAFLFTILCNENAALQLMTKGVIISGKTVCLSNPDYDQMNAIHLASLANRTNLLEKLCTQLSLLETTASGLSTLMFAKTKETVTQLLSAAQKREEVHELVTKRTHSGLTVLSYFVLIPKEPLLVLMMIRHHIAAFGNKIDAMSNSIAIIDYVESVKQMYQEDLTYFLSFWLTEYMQPKNKTKLRFFNYLITKGKEEIIKKLLLLGIKPDKKSILTAIIYKQTHLIPLFYPHLKLSQQDIGDELSRVRFKYWQSDSISKQSYDSTAKFLRTHLIPKPVPPLLLERRLTTPIHFDKPSNFQFSAKEQALENGLSQFNNSLENPIQCLKYIQYIDLHLRHYFKHENGHEFPTLSKDNYRFVNIQGCYYPLPTSPDYKGFKKHSALPKLLMAALAEDDLFKEAYKLIGFAEPETNAFLKRSLLTESCFGAGLFHNKFAHALVLLLLALMIRDGKITCDYTGGKLTLKDYYHALFNYMIEQQTAWDLIVDKVNNNLHEYTSPEKFSTSIMYHRDEFQTHCLSDYMIDSFCKGFIRYYQAYKILPAFQDMSLEEFIDKISDQYTQVFSDGYLNDYAYRREMQKDPSKVTEIKGKDYRLFMVKKNHRTDYSFEFESIRSFNTRKGLQK